MAGKFPFPPSVNMVNVAAGNVSTFKAGGVLHGSTSSALVRIEGPFASLFSVIELDAMVLERDPDAPPGAPPSWQTVANVSGSGPIDLSDSAALAVGVSFSCPVEPTQDAFAATAVVFPEQSPDNRLLEIPLNASVSPGRVVWPEQDHSPCSPVPPSCFRSTLPRPFATNCGIFSCDNSFVPAFTSDSDPQFPILPANGSADVDLPVTCAGGTPAGTYQIDFRYRDLSDPLKVFGLASVQMIVMESRGVSVTASLVPR